MPNRRILSQLAVVIFLAGLSAESAPLSAQSRAKVKPVWPDEGPSTWTPRPTATAITASDLRTRLYGFADDSMLGRRIGEIGNYKGTDYIAREFQRLGLKPAGDGGTYFQNLPYGPFNFARATARLLVGGAALSPLTEWIPSAPTAANGFGPSADLTDVQTVFAGRLGDTSIVLDPVVFRGKVAVYLPAPSASSTDATRRRPSCDAVPNKFGAANAIAVEAVTPATPRAPRDTRAQRAGAVGVLVLGLEDVASSTVNGTFASRMTMQPPAFSDVIAGATISNTVAARIFGKPVAQLAIGTTGQPVSASWSHEWKPSTTPGRNVIAVLRGSDPARASEYVLVGAHNDHNGVNSIVVDHDSLRAVNTITRRQGANDPACIPTPDQQKQIDSIIKRARSIRPARRDSIMNGADDDGSGTVVMLEIAERFAKEKPARSIIFVSHQGEEAGLLGSKWFVDHPTIPLASIVAAHNMDMLGKGRADQVKFGGPNSVQTLGARRLSREFGDIIDSVNAIRSEPMAIDKSWDVTGNPMNRFCRSDQVNYVNKDIPVTYFSLGYAQDYHMQTDEPQYIEYEHSARLGRFIFDIMTAVANRKDKPAIAGPDPSYPSCAR